MLLVSRAEVRGRGAEVAEVADAMIEAHPCVLEMGSHGICHSHTVLGRRIGIGRVSNDF
jgi:hypothetical protein